MDGIANLVEPFGVDQPMHLIFRAEFRTVAMAVLIEAPTQIGRHANVERPVGRARQDVDPTAPARS